MEYDAERDFHPESWTLNFSDLMMTGMLGYGNTSGSEFSMEQPNLLHEGVWRYVLISLFAIVIIFGFLENLLVFVVIVSNKQLHTVTNIFICTLAFSDIYMCVLSLPFQLHYGITNNWDFGKAMCHVIYPLFGVPIFTSTLAILMIAVERFVLIVFPFRRKMSKKLAIVIVTVIVFISVCIALPVFMFTDYQPINIVIPDLNVHIHKAFCTGNVVFKLRTTRVYNVCVRRTILHSIHSHMRSLLPNILGIKKSTSETKGEAEKLPNNKDISSNYNYVHHFLVAFSDIQHCTLFHATSNRRKFGIRLSSDGLAP